MAKKRELVRKAEKKKTRLIRVFEEDFFKIHALAGELQANNEKATSVAEALHFLLDFFKKNRKAVFSKTKTKLAPNVLTELRPQNDPLRLFSLKHQKYLE
ncbi:MAG: hypothetical protein ACK4NX_03065 [Candidatus Paceibacteria bacterium]